MNIEAKMMFDVPRSEFAADLASAFSTCKSAHFVAGFMTVEGINSLMPSIKHAPQKLEDLVVGAATWRALDAFDHLLNKGVPLASLRVHLGHTRATGASARHAFYRYHPMLHSKIYFFEMPDDRALAFVGSHNLTGFALNGLNGEASVRLEGPRGHPALRDALSHIRTAAEEAIAYDPSQRDAYAWWSLQFTEGLADKFRDAPREADSVRTIVILAEGHGHVSPGERIYFELPEGLGRVQSLKAEVHLFIFDALPPSPGVALGMLQSARQTVWCRTVGIEDDRGGRELRADWYLEAGKSEIHRAPTPFRPTPNRGMQQIRVQAYKEIRGEFDYLFDDGKAKFEPIYDRDQEIVAPPDRVPELKSLNLIPPEDKPWYRVQGLVRTDDEREDDYGLALKSLRPESGSFILLSLRRRER